MILLSKAPSNPIHWLACAIIRQTIAQEERERDNPQCTWIIHNWIHLQSFLHSHRYYKGLFITVYSAFSLFLLSFFSLLFSLPARPSSRCPWQIHSLRVNHMILPYRVNNARCGQEDAIRPLIDANAPANASRGVMRVMFKTNIATCIVQREWKWVRVREREREEQVKAWMQLRKRRKTRTKDTNTGSNEWQRVLCHRLAAFTRMKENRKRERERRARDENN